MRCDEIREQIIDFVYDEASGHPIDAGIREHLRTCPKCRAEIEELKQTRKYLQLWKDEPPLHSVTIGTHNAVARRGGFRRYLGYAAIAAMVVLCFMSLANARVVWNKNGFSFSAHLFPQRNAERSVERDYYTKSELRDLMKDALDYTNETNYLMMQKVLDTVEQDRWRDMRLIRGQGAKNQN
jgi:hypothetical protein